MIKAAVFAAAALACAPLVSASTTGADLAIGGGPAPAEVACHLASGLDPACTLRVGEVADAAPLALPDPAGAPDTGFAFKDAAMAPATILASNHEHDGGKPLVPALFTLLALVVLLSRRNTSF